MQKLTMHQTKLIFGLLRSAWGLVMGAFIDNEHEGFVKELVKVFDLGLRFAGVTEVTGEQVAEPYLKYIVKEELVSDAPNPDHDWIGFLQVSFDKAFEQTPVSWILGGKEGLIRLQFHSIGTTAALKELKELIEEGAKLFDDVHGLLTGAG
ncbi:MAG: hypothetical protein KKA90_03390 [Nanoarchaeota archaeon]|nr:hypothetical protein [Nanoarchaeota archaeon]